MPSPNLGFGIEIEAVVRPWKTEGRESWRPPQYWERLAKALRNGGLKALHDPADSTIYRTQHPEHYDKWFLTRDGSLRVSQGLIGLEAVSPKMSFSEQGQWQNQITIFWAKARKVFQVQRETSCGSHIHVAPWERRYTLDEVKRIAFAISYYEPYIVSLLPRERRDNPYCKRNSRVQCKMAQRWQERTRQAWALIAREIKGMTSMADVCTYIQGAENGRSNASTGTIEFRGGRHLRGKHRTMRWITFVVVFISMALTENLINSTITHVPSNKTAEEVQKFWEKLRKHARELRCVDPLPEHFKAMSESRAPTVSRPGSDSDIDT